MLHLAYLAALASSAVALTAPLSRSTAAVWQPAVNTTWQIVLDSSIKLAPNAKTVVPGSAAVFDIDMFGNGNATVAALHALGKKVVCYFSAGSYEPGRPDSGNFTAADRGSELDGWPGEYWLDLNSANVRAIMARRIAYAAAQGCDAIDPDNVDGYVRLHPRWPRPNADARTEQRQRPRAHAGGLC
jgi:hypothetical protein